MATEKRVTEIAISNLGENATFITENNGNWQRVKLDAKDINGIDIDSDQVINGNKKFLNGVSIGDATIVYDSINERLIIDIS